MAVAGHDRKLRTELLAIRLPGGADSGTQAVHQVFKQAELVRRRKLGDLGFKFHDGSGRHVTPLRGSSQVSCLFSCPSGPDRARSWMNSRTRGQACQLNHRQHPAHGWSAPRLRLEAAPGLVRSHRRPASGHSATTGACRTPETRGYARLRIDVFRSGGSIPASHDVVVPEGIIGLVADCTRSGSPE